MNAPRAIPTMLTTRPPPGRRTARAAFELDVFVAPALLELEDLSAPAFAGVGVVVGAAYETEQTRYQR